MPVDPFMKEAIFKAVDSANQSKELSQKIIAWLNALLSGNEDISNDEDALRHLELLYNEVELTEGD
jgi:hypothetical protein